MTDAAGLTSTRHLLADLVTQVSGLLSIETRLVRAELSESAEKATSGLALLAGGSSPSRASLFYLSQARPCWFAWGSRPTWPVSSWRRWR